MLRFTLCLFIILLNRFGLLSRHLLRKSCPLGWPCVLIVYCPFVILDFSCFGFEGGVWFLIAAVPVLCLLFTNSGSITSTGEERACFCYRLLVILLFLFGEVFSFSGCLKEMPRYFIVALPVPTCVFLQSKQLFLI